MNGESLIQILRSLRGQGLRAATGFDTFQGLPELSQIDEESKESCNAFDVGQFRGVGRVEVEAAIRGSVRLPTNFRLQLVEGDFRTSLPWASYDPTLFPLLFHVDCDLYSSSVAALSWVAQIAEDGSWLLADDYWTYRGHPNRGQRRAIAEVFNGSNGITASSYGNYQGWGRAYILHRD